MKVAALFLLSFSCSSSTATGASQSQIRGISDATAEKYSAEARKLAADAHASQLERERERRRELGDAYQRELGQEFNPYDDGAGCSCSKDAVKRIAHEHVDAMEKVPYVTLALLEENRELFSNGGGSYNPLDSYVAVSDAAEDLVRYARCVVLQIDCNKCGVDGGMDSGGGGAAAATDQEETRGRRRLETITPYPDISNYECCCDVHVIEKIVVDSVHDFYKKALLNTGGNRFSGISLASLFDTAIGAVDMTAERYLERYNPFECARPPTPSF